MISPISKLISMSTPNHTGSNPSTFTMGMKMGRQIIMMEMVSMNMPIRNTRACMARSTRRGLTSKPVTRSTRPPVAPLKAKSELKVFEAAMIIRIMTEICTVPARDSRIMCQVSLP